MAAVTNSLFNRHQYRIEEVINKNIEVFMPALDPVWEDTIVSSQGVVGSNELGRDMHVIKVYMGSMNGVIEEGAANYGDVTLYGDTTTAFGVKLHQQNLNQTWPNPLDGANATPYRLAIPMRSMMTNLMLTLGELQAEATPAFIGEVIAPKLEGFARNIAHTLCNMWYVSQNSSYSLCAMTSITNSGATVTFSPGNLATDRFSIGQRVDIYAASGVYRKNDTLANTTGVGQDKTTRIQLYVTKVDELRNVVELTSNVAVASWGPGVVPVAGDLIVYANSGAGASPSFKGIAGINSWMKTGDSNGATNNNVNTLLGAEAIAADAINVNTHPEFKSFFRAVNGVLTEHELRKTLRGFHRAKTKHGQYIDCLIASDGVWLAYEGARIGREFTPRGYGDLSSLRAQGSSNGDPHKGGFVFTMDGRNYTGYTSNYIETGTVYGIRKGGNNWRRIVPPDPKGVSSNERVKSHIPFRFVAGAITGTGTNRLPIYQTSSGNAGAVNLLTEGAQMPGMLRMQIMPWDQPAGLKMTGLTEDRVYADS